MSIHLLSADIYNKIAAGEVVDRPYSVVKELVENAIDAGATEILVEIEGGGKRRIRVTDNGGGIAKAELPLAFASHATSKLQTAEDLFAIQTLGFRGEAVASIAAVSKMQILSRTAEGEAYALRAEGGLLGEVVPAAGAKGTVVSVEDLFFNVPARLKFLKSDAQEEGDIAGVMTRFLLAHPNISFTYMVNGKRKYRSFGDGLPAALAAVYGRDILENCIEIDAEKHGLRLHGFLGDRNFFKPNRTWQSLFVNGRNVVNQTVGAAITNAYASYMMKRQYPFYVLFLDVPPEIVDVNVHPNKADVRFADNQIIYGCVYSIVSAVLDGNSKALEYLVTGERAAQEIIAPASGTASPTVEKERAESELPKLTPAERAAALPAVHSAAGNAPRKQVAFDISMSSVEEPQFLPQKSVQMGVNAPSRAEADAFAENQRYLREQAARAIQERVETDVLIYKGELFQTYLIYEGNDCAYLIDQHAAHERILYDRLRKKLEARTVCAQPMLTPFLLSVNGQEFAFLERNLGLLREIGFEIEAFGEDAVKVSAVPLELMQINLKAFFQDVLSSMETLRAIRLADLVKDKLATAACKAAVKGGERLTEQEARALIQETGGDMGLKCPHGRPAVVKFKKSELEKLFKRIV